MSDPNVEFQANAVMVYRCANEECDQLGIDKYAHKVYEIPMHCGRCGHEMAGNAVVR